MIGAPDRELDPLRGTAAALVFQEPLTALDPLMRVGRQVAEPLGGALARDGRSPSGRRCAQRRSCDLLEQVRPAPAGAHRRLLSARDLRRPAPARGDRHGAGLPAQLLIADEPTTALDVTTQAEILNLLDRLVRERGMALLFISHDLPVVAEIVDRVVVLRKGVAVEAGPVRRSLRRAAATTTRSTWWRRRDAFDAALEGTP